MGWTDEQVGRSGALTLAQDGDGAPVAASDLALSAEWVVGADAGGAAVVAGVLPLRAGLVALAGFALVLFLGDGLHHSLQRQVGSGSLSVVLAVAAQYLAMAALCVGVTRHWGTGSMRADLGLAFKPVDWLDGTIGWLAGVGLVGVIAAALGRLGIPTTTNNPLVSKGEASTSLMPQWLALALAALVMVALAPLLEELLFRGVLFRSLRSQCGIAPALIMQAVAFGLFHADQGRGSGNVGLVAILSTVGLVLGVIAHRAQGRLGAAIVAHGLHNGLAFGLGLAAIV